MYKLSHCVEEPTYEPYELFFPGMFSQVQALSNLKLGIYHFACSITDRPFQAINVYKLSTDSPTYVVPTVYLHYHYRYLLCNF